MNRVIKDLYEFLIMRPYLRIIKKGQKGKYNIMSKDFFYTKCPLVWEKDWDFQDYENAHEERKTFCVNNPHEGCSYVDERDNG